MRRTARLAAGMAVALAASAVALTPASAAPAGPVVISPISGTSATKSIFQTAQVCKASDNVSVVVFGGSGDGATIPEGSPKTMVPSTPVADVSKDGGMVIPSEVTWEQFAQNLGGGPALTVLNGPYTAAVKCENGETFAGVVEFTGSNLTDATYRMMSPSPSVTTQTATSTETKTTTSTATETKTTTPTPTSASPTSTSPKPTTAAPEKPIPVPAQPPTSNGVLTVTGTVISGGGVTVTGTGFKPGSPITVGAWPGAFDIGSAVADSTGKASTAVLIPKTAKGKYTVAMLGYGTDGKERVVSTEVDVISAPDVVIPAELPKADGVLTVTGAIVPGGTVKVSGDGFKPGSPVAIGIYSTGKEIASAVADKDGKATTDLVIPATGYTGKHDLAMVGVNPSNALRALVAPIDIVAPTPAPAPAPESGIPWWVWLLIALVVIAIIIAIIVAMRRGKRTPWDDALSTQAAAAQRIADTQALAISDRGRDAATAITEWNNDLPGIQTTEAQINQLVQTAPDDARRSKAQSLLGATVALREALNEDVQLRANESAPGQAALLSQSAGVVAQRRQELSTVVATIPPLPNGSAPAHR